jgi:outer membrane protein OmpA-like peptidoglycan-associated protein
MRKPSVVAAVICTILAHEPVYAQDVNERIRIGVSLIQLACGTGSGRQTLSVEGKPDSGVTLKKPSSGESVSYSKNEVQGLLAELKNDFNEGIAKFSRDQMECMKPYVNRIFDIVFPPQKTPEQRCQDVRPRIRLWTKEDGEFLVFFNYGDAKLWPEGMDILREFVMNYYFDHPGISVSVIGYADAAGAEEDQTISEMRANAVAEILIDSGVARDRLSVAARGSCGLHHPAAAGVRDPLNRVVEIILHY